MIPGEVGSSTMPHKINPIDFENGEGNLGLANALLTHLAAKLPISRWQRDLSDSTVMRNLGSALGYCLLAWQSILRGLGKLELDPRRLHDDLQAAWSVLAEAVQTMMRRHGVPDSYERMKEFTRGRDVGAAEIRSFIDALEIPQAAKQRLLDLEPSIYIGNAAEQARDIRCRISDLHRPDPR